MNIETERLILRPYKKNDLQDVYEQFSSKLVTKYLKGTKTLEETKKYIAEEAAYLDKNFPLGKRAMVLKETNKVIGYCSLKPLLIEGKTTIIELSYGLNHDYWKKSYATEAAKAMLDYGFNVAGLTEISSVINPKNIASIKIAKKLGLQYQRDVDWPNQGKVNLFTARSQE